MTHTRDFDELYAETWRPLLLQTFALVGDLGTSREALQHAYADAWHHWSRAARKGPESYVRAHAFQRAQWRVRSRAFRGSARVSKQQRLTLRALQGLPAQTRKAVVLGCLSELSLAEIGQQIGATHGQAEELLATGLLSLRTTFSAPDHEIARRLRALETPARAAAQPVPEDLRRQGVRRRRTWLAAGCVSAVALSLLAGAFVRAPHVAAEQKLPPPMGSTVHSSMLLDPVGLQPLGQTASWTVLGTSDNTAGTGLNSFCQASRFADPQGLRAFVRTFAFNGQPQRMASQTIELSRTAGQARQGFQTALGWYAGCKLAPVQLLSSYDISGLGDQAEILKFRVTGAELRSYAVALARTGNITTWIAVTTMGALNPTTEKLLGALSASVQRLCRSKAATRCAAGPRISENAPPPSGAQAGMLDVTDLPSVGSIDKPWVGTDAVRAANNPAATTCDRADFNSAGASRSLSRTFVIPDASTPARFGLSETLGRFPNAGQAEAFARHIRDRMDRCQKNDPGAQVSHQLSQQAGPSGSSWYLWRLESQVTDKRSINYWTAVVRAGSSVAQVTFVPAGSLDLDETTFQALTVRSRDRLFELPTTGVPSSSRPRGGAE